MTSDLEPRRNQPSGHAYFAGVLLLLGAAVLWSLNGALIKLIHRGGEGPPGVVIAFYRSLLAGLFLLPWARGRLRTLGRVVGHTCLSADRGGRTVQHAHGLRPAALACVVFFTLMTVCFVVANTKTEAANAIILQYTSTFWVFGLSPWIVREKPRPRDLRILGLVAVGIAVIFLGNAGTDLIGLLNALAAGLVYGLLTMMIRRMRDSDPAAVTVLNSLGSALLILPFALLTGGMIVSGREALLLLIMGVVQFGLPYYLFSLGLARVPAYQASLITLVEPVLVPLWTYLAVGEIVPTTTVIGGSVILAALVVFLSLAARVSRTRAAREMDMANGAE